MQTDGTFNYTYDNEGNTTRRTRIVGGQVTEYTWDHRNRMTSVIDRVSATGAKTQQVEYVYDAFDQLTGKRVATQFNSTGAPTNWSRYEVFAWADGQEVLRFVDSDGQGAAQPARIANRYLSGAAVDQLLADEQYAIGSGPAVNTTTSSTVQGNTLRALTDHLGSVRDLVDNNGVIREHNVYDSFGRLVREVDYNAAGQVIASTDPAAVDTLFGYTGRLFDQHTGLQYNRARWYDASTGRWLSQDPIGFAAGDMNLYRYTGNSPVSRVDPDGLDWWETNDPEDLDGERDYNAWGGWHPLGWNFPFGQKTITFYAMGGWSAASESNRLARARREFERKQSQGADWDGNVKKVINTYRATECEIDGIKQAVETGINYNAMVLGGGLLRPSGVGLVDDLPLLLQADQAGVNGLRKYSYSLSNGQLRRSLSPGVTGSFKGQRIDFIINSDGQLILGRGHSVLSDGHSVKFAGELKFDRNGKLVEITNNSGHFQPASGKGLTQKAKDYLGQLGVDVACAEISEVGS